MASERLREIHSAVEIRERVDQLAERIAGDYPGSLPVLLPIAEGALRFCELLTSSLDRRGRRTRVQVVRARRTRGTELGEVRVDPFDTASLVGRDVLVLDDIADEGRTLAAVLAELDDAKVSAARVAVLVSKSERRRVTVPLDYVGFEVKSGWVVGVGMDLDGRYRDLDSLAIWEPEEETT